MNAIGWALIAAGSAYLLTTAVVVVVRRLRAKTAQSKQDALEVPAPHLEDQRLMDGSETCFSCHKNPPVVDGLWCKGCADRIHDLDSSDTRPLEDK